MNCTAVIPLPLRTISHAFTGQFLPTGELWSEKILFSWGDPNVKALQQASISEMDSPIASAFWDIFIMEDTIVYHRENCVLRDVVNPFYLHLYPLSLADLPEAKREYGFENLDFWFIEHGAGAHIDGDCIAVRDLPSWDIASIITGQYHPYREEQLWTAEFSPRRE